MRWWEWLLLWLLVDFLLAPVIVRWAFGPREQERKEPESCLGYQPDESASSFMEDPK